MNWTKFVDYDDLRDRGIPYCKTHLARLVKLKKFPAPLSLGTGVNSKKVWTETQINEYVEKLLAGDPVRVA